jgi:glyoxylase-like metal-dependent hydrolase (beta-lactamase superfamily II)
MAVTREIFQFQIGELDCIALNDGTHEYRIETVFPTVDRRVLEQALRSRGEPIDRVSSPYASLYVDTGEHRILVDTGAGDFFPTTGRLPANLSKAGVDPAEIDRVVITHAHLDHMGGLLTRDGTPTYPNARVYTTKTEWDFWLAEDALERVPWFELTIEFAHRVFDTIGDRFHFVQPDSELVPGIRLLAAFGHTPGQIAVEVSSSDESLIYISDAVLHPLQVEHPDWLPDEKYIVDTEQFQETARRLLTQAAAKNALVLGMHFPPFPCLGHVVETGEGLRWQPILVSE